MPARKTHPIVKAAAALVVLAAGAAGVWAGSYGGSPRPVPVDEASGAIPSFLPATDTATRSSADAQKGADLFAQRCSRCHTVGGGNRKEGPDLAQAALRRDIGWVRA